MQDTVLLLKNFFDGEEASFIVMVDGENVLQWQQVKIISASVMVTQAQTPAEWGLILLHPSVVTPEIHQQVMDNIIYPTVKRHGCRRTSLSRFSLCRLND